MRMRRRHLKIRGMVVGALALIAWVSYEAGYLAKDVVAIPAFARKYNFSCNVCHVPGFPKLNDFGNVFRDHGYQLGADMDLPTHKSITMGYWPMSLRSIVGYRTITSGWAGDMPTQANASCVARCGGAAGGGRSFYRMSVDASTTFDGQWNLFGAFIHAEDSKDLISAAGTAAVNAQAAKWNGGFVELDWTPTTLPYFNSPNWMFLYRYDLIRNEQQGNRAFRGDFNNVDSHTWMARYYLHFSPRTDIAWHVEYNWLRTRAAGTNGQDLIGQLFFTGFDFAL
jgi:hypothetical protein